MKKTDYYILVMFPYTEAENHWISKTHKPKKDNLNIVLTLLVGISAALLSATIPSLIYFLKLNII